MASCSKKRKNEGTKESCRFGKYLQEECHQKTKVELNCFLSSQRRIKLYTNGEQGNEWLKAL